MQIETDYPGDYPSIQDPFEERFAAAGSPEDWALFNRHDIQRQLSIFLMSPAAAVDCSLLGGHVWAESVDRDDHGWALLVGIGDPHGRFGLMTLRQARDRDLMK